MQSPASAATGLVLMLLAGACTSSSLPTLPPPMPAGETGDSSGPPRGAYETAVVVSGTPTGVYTVVARGVLGCWFGADGPLKATHVFHADAAPPATGGAAEIALHERDVTYRDQRGVRAYRIAFSTEATGVRVGSSALKMEAQLAQIMAKDVEVWAKGGAGCLLRTLLPPPAPVAGKGLPGPAVDKKR
jgi:hypothetical protein